MTLPDALIGRLRRALVAAMLWAGCQAILPPEARGQESPTPEPKIEFEPPELTMGATYLGETAKGSFKIWNRGDAPLVISKIKRSCGCAVAALREEDKTITPGEYTTVQVSLKPKGNRHNSVFKKALYVMSNDPRKPRAPYRVSTTLLLPIGVEPQRIVFKDVVPGETVTRKIVLTSATEDEFEISGVRLPDGPVSAKFEKGVGARSHEVELVVGPLKGRNINAVCTVLTTHPRMKQVKVPLYLQITRLVTVEPRTLMLGRVPPGSTVTRQIRLIPAKGRTIEYADLQVQRYSMIEAAATKAPGDNHLWNVSFRIPLELAGQTIATRVNLSTNIENAGQLAFNINVRVDSNLNLGPDIPSEL